MNKQLKQEIINFILENEKVFQLQSITIGNFKEYIYNSQGNYLIGGQDVAEFIGKAVKLLTN
jgi:hypothetical protein